MLERDSIVGLALRKCPLGHHWRGLYLGLSDVGIKVTDVERSRGEGGGAGSSRSSGRGSGGSHFLCFFVGSVFCSREVGLWVFLFFGWSGVGPAKRRRTSEFCRPQGKSLTLKSPTVRTRKSFRVGAPKASTKWLGPVLRRRRAQRQAAGFPHIAPISPRGPTSQPPGAPKGRAIPAIYKLSCNCTRHRPTNPPSQADAAPPGLGTSGPRRILSPQTDRTSVPPPLRLLAPMLCRHSPSDFGF